MKKILITLLCGVLLLSGCTADNGTQMPVTQDSPSQITLNTPNAGSEASETTAPATEPDTLSEAPETEPLAPQFPQIEALRYDIEPSDFSELYECENALFGAGAEASDALGDSSSGLTVRVFGGSVIIPIEPPTSQHYDITLRASADLEVSGRIQINGEPRGGFTLSGTCEFETVIFKNIYIPGGEAQIAFSDISDTAELDCVLVENSASDLSADAENIGSLITPDADPNAAALYEYLKSIYGRAVLSGQQVSQGSNAEIEQVYALTGKYPAIRFGELMDYSAGVDSGDIELAISWAENGGIVGYSWYWAVGGTCYKDRTSFDPEKAVTALDIAAMEPDALNLRLNDGEITAETATLVAGIDLCAAELKKLADRGIPVLFRPLPEASGGQFWWSASKESYLWLYKLIFERMNIYHGLKNLIWVWNGQDPEWYPGDGLADIISLDIYYPQNYPDASPSGINQLLAARDISTQKPVAVSESSQPPQPDAVSRDRAYFLYASVWNGEYAPDGGHAPQSSWIHFYNSSDVITRDKIEYNR